MMKGASGDVPGIRDDDPMCRHTVVSVSSQAAKNGATIRDADIYITHTPCIHCFKVLLNTGIRRIFYEKPYKLGEAWLTGGGNMSPPLKGIVHVASMNRRGESDLGVVRDCLASALDLAVEKKFKSIAVGSFGSGPNAIDPTAWLRTFVHTVVPYLARAANQAEGQRLSVLLVLFEPDDFDRAFRFLTSVVEELRAEVDLVPGAAPDIVGS